MVQKVRVQDGNIVYTSTDDNQLINMGIKGNVTVTEQLNVGNNPAADGIIRTAGSGNMVLTTVQGGNIVLAPVGGRVVVNNVLWPSSTTPYTGSFLGVTSTGVLSYCPFIMGIESVDTLSDAELDIRYPSAIPGQSVLGPNVIYYCVGTAGDKWRIVNAGNGGGSLMSIRNVPLSSYILQQSDAFDTMVRCTSSTNTTITVPNDNTIFIPIGAKITISKSGNGDVTISSGPGVTLYSEGGSYTLTTLFSRRVLIKVAANTWEMAI